MEIKISKKSQYAKNKKKDEEWKLEHNKFVLFALFSDKSEVR